MQPRTYHIEKCGLVLEGIRLIQLGRTHCTRDYAMEDPVHIHQNWFELTHVSEGKGTIVTNGIPTKVCPGDIYLSFPGDVHAVYTDTEDLLKFDFLSFWPEDKALLARLEEIMLSRSDPGKRLFFSRDVEHLMDSATSEALSSDSDTEILTMTLQLLVRHLLRAFRGKKRAPQRSVSTAQELCYQMMNYISTHIYVMEDLTDLADFFGYSYSYLSDLFRRTTGETLEHHYTARRMNAAAMLLKEQALSVGKIAELLQYSSIYTFSRAFKAHFGVSPSQYKI